MSTSFPASPMMARRHHTLHHSSLNTSQSNGSLASMNHQHKHRMNRSSKTTTGGYTTRDETEVEPSVKSPVKKASVIQEPSKARHPLMEEIARLTASCQEHEREIRASHTTINRKLQDFSQNFDALTELDNQAETMTAHINQLLISTQTAHTQAIFSTIDEPKRKFVAMQAALEPWADHEFDQDDSSELEAVVGGRQGIPRIRRDEKVDGLARLEQQADIVKTYYETEQARLSSLLRAKWGKRRLFGKIISFTSTAIVLAGIIIWLLLWTFEWR